MQLVIRFYAKCHNTLSVVILIVIMLSVIALNSITYASFYIVVFIPSVVMLNVMPPKNFSSQVLKIRAMLLIFYLSNVAWSLSINRQTGVSLFS
jgi:hypothetical protein